MGEHARLRSEDWTVVPVPFAEAKRLVGALHYSRSHSNTAVATHGLRRNTVLADTDGVAWWLPPTRSAAVSLHPDRPEGVLTLSRLVVAPHVPTNGASFLLGRSMKLLDRQRWPVLVTYADTNQGHTGAIYRATNWECDGPVDAGDVWVDELGRLAGRKRGPRTLTHAEMVESGYTMRPQRPKIRFVHRL